MRTASTTHLLWPLTLALALGTACKSNGCGTTTTTTTDEGGGPPPADVGVPVATDAFYVAIMPDAAPGQTLTPEFVAARCEAPDAADEGWTGTPMFEPPGAEVPPALARFCRYAWNPEFGDPTPLRFDEAPAERTPTKIDPDPRILLPQAPATGPGDLATLRGVQHDLMMLALGKGPTTLTTDTVGVRPYVAIVDTTDRRALPDPLPDYASAPAPQRHGLMMANLVNAIRCEPADADCQRRLLLTQAFPDGTTAGQLGSVGSLAMAVGHAVIDHAAQPDAAQAGLVLNLSVAWDPDRDGDGVDEDALPPDHMNLLSTNGRRTPVLAMHTALVWASCRGAITLAAAGNDRGRIPQQDGVMAPASWRGAAAPSLAQCDERFGGSPLGADGRAELVLAVDGVDSAGEPIANARRGHDVRRVLYSDSAALRLPGGGSTERWTGTSIATAALSGIVGAGWQDRNVTPAAIVQALDNAAVADGGRQRLYADRTVATIRGATPPPAPAPDAIDARYAQRLDTGRTYFVTQPPPAGSTLGGAPESLPAAEALPLPGTGTLTAYGSIDRTGDDLDPTTRPQPHIPICPTCDVTKVDSGGQVDYQVDLIVAPEYSQRQVTAPTIALGGNNGIAIVLPDSEVDQRVSLSRYTIPQTNPPQSVAEWIEQNSNFNNARVSMTVDGQPPQTVTDVVTVIR